MEVRDRGLKLVGAGTPLPEGMLHQGGSLGDGRVVPQRPVLVLQHDEVPARVGAGAAPGMMQEHEGEEATDLGLVRHELVQVAAQPDRLGREVGADQIIAGTCCIPLVEHQIDDGEYRGEPVEEVVVGRHLEGNIGVLDLALRPHDSLRQRRLRDQEGPGDLRGPKPSYRPQRQRDLGVGRERRVAAHEDQAELVVDAWLGVSRGHLRSPHIQFGLGLEVSDPPLLGSHATHTVDRPPAGSRREPGTGAVGYPFGGPGPQCRDVGVLQSLFCQIEVA